MSNRDEINQQLNQLKQLGIVNNGNASLFADVLTIEVPPMDVNEDRIMDLLDKFQKLCDMNVMQNSHYVHILRMVNSELFYDNGVNMKEVQSRIDGLSDKEDNVLKISLDDTEMGGLFVIINEFLLTFNDAVKDGDLDFSQSNEFFESINNINNKYELPIKMDAETFFDFYSMNSPIGDEPSDYDDYIEKESF